jgi:N-acetylglucosaminyl-diphospho-decaprenol L-rhamnosyltransferase
MLNSLDRVTVIIVTYNSEHCIESLAKAIGRCPHVVVVDNNSQDQTKERVKRHLPKSILIPQKENVGFGAANNRGLAVVQTEFCVLLNPDCQPENRAFEKLVDTADQFPNASLIAPQLINRNGKRDQSYRWDSSKWESTGPVADEVACIGFASGACLLIRTESLKSIGGFDENYFLYYEDEDLCLRLNKFCGPLIVSPKAIAHHQSRRSTSKNHLIKAEFLRGYHHIQSKFYFTLKHRNEKVKAIGKIKYAAFSLLELAIRLLAFDFPRATRSAGRIAGSLSWNFKAKK